jgi:hypothetical protein
MLAESPKATLYTGGSDGFVSSTTAPIATGRSNQLPGGIRTHWKSPPLHGADSDEAGHPFRSKPATLSERSDEQGSWLIEVAALATGGSCVVCHASSFLPAGV